ncbi:MAG: sugar phosphate nucleotidyltransferase [Pseudomonadota bacterium]|nr:sugar phosphate nucleotidyltransferase [Pseudomonadota bacterium]
MFPPDFYAVVLAGGRGTRFWPLSRRTVPKQCLSLDGGPTLLQRTVARTGLPPERILVVTGPDMVEPVRAQIPGIEVLVEPSARNTAPAIAWATWEVARRGGAGCVVLPSDHVILDEPAFRASIAQAAEVARGGALVTLGVRPTRPETGYGWIEPDDGPDGVATESQSLDRPVRRFVEKPPLETAERLLAGGRHLWNAGMFVWTTGALLDAVHAHLPGTAAMLDRLGEGAAIADVWGLSDATSIDYGVMERAAHLRVVPVDFGWSDVGSWPALLEVLPHGEGGVSVADAIVARRADGNIVHAAGKLVALLGVDDLIVVDTPDALLVARRSDAQEVRLLLEEVERRGLGRYA